MKTAAWILGALILLGVVSYGIYSLRARSGAPTPSAVSLRTSTARSVPAGSLEYRNAAYHISLLYPDSLSVHEYGENGGGATFVFAGKDAEPSFQIFVTPYEGTTVSADRFKMDEPSGVLAEQQQVTVGGVPGISFFGKNAILGDTREVWFIKDGYLYEVTTTKDQDAWLAQLMTSWQFI